MDLSPRDPALSRARAWARRHPWVRLAVLALVYALAALLGRTFRLPDGPLALAWPASAVGFLWLALSWSDRRRLAVDAAALALVTGAVNALTGAPYDLCVVFAVANVVQAAATCAVMRRLQPLAWRLRTPQDLTVLVGACLAGSLASGLVGPVGVWLTSGGRFWPTLVRLGHAQHQQHPRAGRAGPAAGRRRCRAHPLDRAQGR